MMRIICTSTSLAAWNSTIIDVTNNTATVNIADQSSKYPVISYAHSTVTFNLNTNSYSAKLQNKVSIMKFNVTTPSTAAICFTGMNNTVSVNFETPNGTDNGFSYDKDATDGGLIKMPAKDAEGTTWAIVLPQERGAGWYGLYGRWHVYRYAPRYC